jgi:protein-S-isoprenylcysteine O-methyltransferase Ste14
MIYILLSVCAVGIVHFCDPIAIKKLPFLKPVVWIIGMSVIAYSAIMTCLWPDKFELPIWTTWFGWILLVLAVCLLGYSLFISLPFRKTYINSGIGDRLVTTGFYALTRHPGVLWMVLLLIGLILVSKSYLMLIAAPIFFLVDVVAVVIQDRFYFGRMFSGYADYRKHTPMLLPNKKSIKEFFLSIKMMNQQKKAERGDRNVESI